MRLFLLEIFQSFVITSLFLLSFKNRNQTSVCCWPFRRKLKSDINMRLRSRFFSMMFPLLFKEWFLVTLDVSFTLNFTLLYILCPCYYLLILISISINYFPCFFLYPSSIFNHLVAYYNAIIYVHWNSLLMYLF